MSPEEVLIVKGLLVQERCNQDSASISLIPIVHNKGFIILQFCGWAVQLHEDGTWFWEDTTGG